MPTVIPIKVISIEQTAIKRFMETWPCSGLGNIHHITSCFDDKGNLVDLESFADEYEKVEIHPNEYEGTGAMPTLLHEAFENCKEIATPENFINKLFTYD